MLDYSSDPALALSDQSQVIAWNHKAEELTGYSAAEVIGRQCWDVVGAILNHGEPLCAPNCEIFDCLRTQVPFAVNACRIRHKKRDWISVNISSLVIPPQDQSPDANSAVAVVFFRSDQATNLQVPKHETLRVFTLGHFGLAVGDRGIGIERWKRKQALTLLKCLVAQLGRPVDREWLLDWLWPDIDEKRGWDRLKVAIAYLRRELRANGIRGEVVKTVGNAYLLRRDAVWVDADVFEHLINSGKELQEKRQWSDAVRRYDEAQCLYRGDYLEEERFSDWCAAERERLHEIYLEMLARLAECHAELNQYARAIEVCRKALAFDSGREDMHCALMKYLVKHGQSTLALDQYQRCRRTLLREFGVEPLPDTQRLYQKILDQRKNIPASDKQYRGYSTPVHAKSATR